MAGSAGPERGAGPLEERSREVRDIFESRYLDYQYRFVEFFAEHLSDLSRSFRGDLQAMLILAIIGQVRIAGIVQQSRDGSPREDQSWITASRLADVTGIPRETVRRKLAILEKKGWIVPAPEKGWQLILRDQGAVARRDLSDLDQRAMARISRLFAGLEALLPEDKRQRGRRG